MNEDEMIKELAKPIIKKLQELEKQYGQQSMVEIPKIKFIRDYMHEPLEVEGVEITDEFLDKLEEYVQEELESTHRPIIMH
ncbi:MAG: hypothetical protein J6D18_03680 [Erysipelotrichaceae bacterium]|nr:hypothetical protein [Erysipelotrichaceae bacterium]